MAQNVIDHDVYLRLLNKSAALDLLLEAVGHERHKFDGDPMRAAEAAKTWIEAELAAGMAAATAADSPPPPRPVWPLHRIRDTI